VWAVRASFARRGPAKWSSIPPVPNEPASGDASILEGLASVAADMRRNDPLELLLQRVVDHAAALIGSSYVSLRLLGDCGTLLATCRHGAPIHTEPSRFHPGEGLIGLVADRGAALRLDDAERHPAFVKRPGQRMRIASWLGVPLHDEERVIGVLAAVDATPGRFDACAQHLLEILAGLCAPRIGLARLSHLARIDALTLTLNRHGLRAVIDHHASKRGTLSLMVIDLDHFKTINDTQGHAAGDDVLVAFSSAMSSVVRREDEICRYGGDEFVILLPDTPLSDAMPVASRVREAAQTLPGASGLTVSIGVAERGPDETLDAAMARADAALYAAKDAGRDRVVAAEPAR
jgi:diguanylate cyclase (GGDEF)-like protein